MEDSDLFESTDSLSKLDDYLDSDTVTKLHATETKHLDDLPLCDKSLCDQLNEPNVEPTNRTELNKLLDSSDDLNLDDFFVQNFDSKSSDNDCNPNSVLLVDQEVNECAFSEHSDTFIEPLQHSEQPESKVEIEQTDLEEFDFEHSPDKYSLYKNLNLSSFLVLEQLNEQPATMNMADSSTNLIDSLNTDGGTPDRTMDDSSVNNQNNEVKTTTTPTPTRRSNRQKEKEEKTKLDKIKEENQRILKLSKEAEQNKQSIITKETETEVVNNSTERQTSNQPAFNEPIDTSKQTPLNSSTLNDDSPKLASEDESNQSIAKSVEPKTSARKTKTVAVKERPIIEPRQSTRPQRQRKIPKRLDEDYEVGDGFRRLSNVSNISPTKSATPKKQTDSSTKEAVKLDKFEPAVCEQNKQEEEPSSHDSGEPTKHDEIKVTEETKLTFKEDNKQTTSSEEDDIKSTEVDTSRLDQETKLIDQEQKNLAHEDMKSTSEEDQKADDKQTEEDKVKSEEAIEQITSDQVESTNEAKVDTIESESKVESESNIESEPKAESEPKEKVQTEIESESKEKVQTESDDKMINDDKVESNESESSRNDDKNVQLTREEIKYQTAVVESIFNKKSKKVKKLDIQQNKQDVQSSSHNSSEDELQINEKTSAEQQKIVTAAQKKKNYSKDTSNLSDGDKPKRLVVKRSIQDNEKQTSSDEEIDEDEESDEEQDDDDEWNSEEDPDKLWCICRKPHNNRFMIQCDNCKNWYHGSCVGITQSQGCQYEKQGKKWFCSACREEQLNDRKLIPDRKPVSVKDKLKHRHLPPIVKQRPSIGELRKRKSLEAIELKKRKSLDSQQQPNKSDELKKRRSSLDNQPGKKLKRSPEHKEKISKLSRPQDEESLRLKKLIQHKKEEFKKKNKESLQLKHAKSLDRKSPPSVDRSSPSSSNQDSVKSDQLANKASSNKQDNDKKKKNSQIDPFIGDLFKPAEPVVVQKTKKLMKRSNSTSSSDIVTSLPSNCVHFECKKSIQKIDDKESVYCSKECLENHAKELISLVKKIKLQNAKAHSDRKLVKDENKRITLVDKKSGKYLSGPNSIAEDKILEFILNNPTYEILLPSSRKHSTNDSLVSKKVELDKSSSNQSSNTQSSSSKDTSSKETVDSKPRLSETETVRKGVKKQLKKAFLGRLKSCKDLEISESEVKKIASTIENELFKHFNKDVINSKYKTRFRSLLFNLNDTKNEGLFKRVLTNKLQSDKLVQMSSEELASPELAKWRERENRHSIEMIKKDAEQQAHQVVVKKTHKGEEVIETKVELPLFDEPKKPDTTNAKEEGKASTTASTNKAAQSTVPNSLTAKIVSAKDKPGTNPLDLLFKDTTEEHDKHLFDLHCKICTNQAKEDLSLTHKPKPLSSFERQLLESRNDLNNERLNTDSNSSNVSSRQGEHHPPNHQKTIHSCWNGYINFQEIAKFIAFAYKVSGIFESQDVVDSIQVCGRIAPQQVYYYLKEIKNTSRNDITILKFLPANDQEKVGYELFFTYLHKRSRFGVVGNSGKTIKDFYIFPLAKDQELDKSMLPLDTNGIGLEPVNHRPNYLLGLLVRRSTHSKDHVKEHHDKSIHYSPNTNFTKVSATTASKSSPNTNQSHHQATSSHTPPKRSYTPPPIPFGSRSNKTAASEENNSNSMDDGSYTPPRKDEQVDEPYDPEFHTLDYPAFKRQKVDHHKARDERNENERPIEDGKDDSESKEEQNESTPNKNLVNLLEHLSKNAKLCENGLIKVITNELAKISSIEERQQLLDELKRKVEDSERQLEIKRKATENAFSQATGSGSNNFDSNVIPGLDGDFSSMNDINEPMFDEPSASNFIPNDLPEGLKEILEKFTNVEDLTKASLLDDPIVKNYANLTDETEEIEDKKQQEQLLDEPMDLDDDEEDNQNTIIEVNNLNNSSYDQDEKAIDSTQLTDDELLKKASLQLDLLAKQKAEDTNQTKSQSN